MLKNPQMIVDGFKIALRQSFVLYAYSDMIGKQ